MDTSGSVWRKSTHSNIDGCVEVSFAHGQVAVRDSKDQGGPVLAFTPVEWQAFLLGVRDGEFDLAGRSSSTRLDYSSSARTAW